VTGCVSGGELVDWYEAMHFLGIVTMECGARVGARFVRR
jgi:hypothetical protein